MTPMERKEKAWKELALSIDREVSAARYGDSTGTVGTATELAIKAYAAACVAEALDEWRAIVQLRLERRQKEKAMETVQK